MACAYLFSLIAVISLPDILIQAGVLPAADAHSQGGIAEILERLDQMAPLVNGGGAKIAAEPSTGSA